MMRRREEERGGRSWRTEDGSGLTCEQRARRKGRKKRMWTIEFKLRTFVSGGLSASDQVRHAPGGDRDRLDLYVFSPASLSCSVHVCPCRGLRATQDA